MLIRKVLKENLIAEGVSITVGVIAGLGLASIIARFTEISGLMILLPMLLGMSNDIDGAVAAKIGSALHLGVIDVKLRYSKDLFNIIFTAFLLSVLEAVSAGILTFALSRISGFASAELSTLVGIALFTGFVSKIISIPTTAIVAVLLFGRGIDPDSVMGPILTSYGDVLTIGTLYLATLLTQNPYFFIIVFGIVGFFFLIFSSLHRILWSAKDVEERKPFYTISRMFRESAPTLLIPMIATAPAGLVLSNFEETLVLMPTLLILLPPLNDLAGDFGCVIASRLSTALYLGRIQPWFKGISELKNEFITILVTGMISSIYLGVTCHFSALILGFESIGITVLVILSLITTTMLIVFEFIIGTIVGLISFSKGLDPDNITIPIVTDLGDTGGIIFLMYFSLIIGVLK